MCIEEPSLPLFARSLFYSNIPELGVGEDSPPIQEPWLRHCATVDEHYQTPKSNRDCIGRACLPAATDFRLMLEIVVRTAFVELLTKDLRS